MDNLYFLVNKWVVMLASLVVIYYTFKDLNQCGLHTPFIIRIPLVIFFSSSVGAFIYAKSDLPIHWTYSLIIIGVAVHFIGNRRSVRYPQCNSITNQ